MSSLSDQLLWEAYVSHLKNANKRVMVKIQRIWSKKLKSPAYSAYILFPGQDVEIPETTNLDEIYDTIAKNLRARGYDSSKVRDIQPELSYHNWEDTDALVNEPQYDVDIHMSHSAFNQAMGDLFDDTETDFEDEEEDDEEEDESPLKSVLTPYGELRKGDRIKLVKDLRMDKRWADGEDIKNLPRVGTHGKIIDITEPNPHVTYKIPHVLVQFKGNKYRQIVIDPSFVRKIGLNSFE